MPPLLPGERPGSITPPQPGAEGAAFSARFWGVRGTIPCPGPGTIRYGGNTACVELGCGGRRLVLDCGSGLRPLGEALDRDGAPVDLDILFSHFHLDHIMGLPVFLPAYRPGNRLRLWADTRTTGGSLEAVLHKLMSMPLFPVGPEAFKAQIEIHQFECGQDIVLQPGLRLQTAALNHPGGAVGYRVEYGGKALAYITDTEHPPTGIDANALALAREADLAIYDAAYTEEEYVHRVGWGHSTWQHGVSLAEAAQVKVLALFHHDPAHDDDVLDGLAEAARAARKGTWMAREGTTLPV